MSCDFLLFPFILYTSYIILSILLPLPLARDAHLRGSTFGTAWCLRHSIEPFIPSAFYLLLFLLPLPLARDAHLSGPPAGRPLPCNWWYSSALIRVHLRLQRIIDIMLIMWFSPLPFHTLYFIHHTFHTSPSTYVFLMHPMIGILALVLARIMPAAMLWKCWALINVREEFFLFFWMMVYFCPLIPDILSWQVPFFPLSLISRKSEKEVCMGKGDQRTKRGKIHRGTYGKTRPRKKKKTSKQAQEKK